MYACDDGAAVVSLNHYDSIELNMTKVDPLNGGKIKWLCPTKQ